MVLLSFRSPHVRPTRVHGTRGAPSGIKLANNWEFIEHPFHALARLVTALDGREDSTIAITNNGHHIDALANGFNFYSCLHRQVAFWPDASRESRSRAQDTNVRAADASCQG